MTIPATPQRSEIPEGLTNYPVLEIFAVLPEDEYCLLSEFCVVTRDEF